jgi:hypothetical protein
VGGSTRHPEFAQVTTGARYKPWSPSPLRMIWKYSNVL